MGLGSCLHLPLLAAAGSTVPETRRGHTDNLLRMRWCGNCCGWQEVGAAHELDDVTLWEELTTLEGGARPGVKGQEWGQERDDEFTLEVHKCGWEDCCGIGLWSCKIMLTNLSTFQTPEQRAGEAEDIWAPSKPLTNLWKSSAYKKFSCRELWWPNWEDDRCQGHPSIGRSQWLWTDEWPSTHQAL